MSDKYNGWTNWETWCLHLHLTSDNESTYLKWLNVLKWIAEVGGRYNEEINYLKVNYTEIVLSELEDLIENGEVKNHVY